MKAKSQINLLLFSIGRVANRCPPPTIQGVTLVSTVGWGRGSRTAAHLIRFKLYCTLFFFCLLSSASWLVDLRFNLALNHSLRDKQAAVLVTADAQHSGTKQTAQQTVRQTDSGTDSETGNPVFIGHNNHVLLSICKFALRFSLFLVFYSVFFFFFY